MEEKKITRRGRKGGTNILDEVGYPENNEKLNVENLKAPSSKNIIEELPDLNLNIVNHSGINIVDYTDKISSSDTKNNGWYTSNLNQYWTVQIDNHNNAYEALVKFDEGSPKPIEDRERILPDVPLPEVRVKAFDSEKFLTEMRERAEESQKRAKETGGILSQIRSNSKRSTWAYSNPFDDEALKSAGYEYREPSYKSNSEEVKEEIEYKYKLYLTNQRVRFIKYPASMGNLTVEELVPMMEKGVRDIFVVDNLPSNKDVKAKKTSRNVPPAPAAVNNSITREEFVEKTKGLFKEISIAEFEQITTVPVRNADYLNSFTNEGTCRANIVLRDNAQINRGVPRGQALINYLTTGVYNVQNNTVEVIQLDTVAGQGTLTFGNFSTYKLVNVDPNSVSVTSSGNATKFFKVLIKDSPESTKLFGNKAAREKLKGTELLANEVNFERDYYSSKLDKHITTVNISIKGNVRSTTLRFLPEEVQFLVVDKEKLSKTKSKKPKTVYTKNMTVKIINDKRLGNFKKGDIVTLVSLTKNNNNLQNSKIVVKNENGTTETILLKQVKPYGNKNIEKKVEQPKINYDEILKKLRNDLVITTDRYHATPESPLKRELARRHGEISREISIIEKDAKLSKKTTQASGLQNF